DWLKVKCFRTHRFMVIGYTTEVIGGKDVLSTLALAGTSGDAGDDRYYAGRVEFGVPRRDDTLLRVLRSLGVATVSIASASENAAIRWVEPRLMAEVRCLAWKPGRHIRHAVLRSVSPAKS